VTHECVSITNQCNWALVSVGRSNLKEFRAVGSEWILHDLDPFENVVIFPHS